MAGPAASYKAVIAALVANSFITLIKFVAFAYSGSGAMLSEAIHSAADAGNQALLFVGLKRGQREGDEAFHYGYGGERFIFGVLSAAGIFFIGCGVTVYHGIHALLHPSMPELSALTFIVLGVSLLVEGGSTVFAFVTVMKHRKDEPVWTYLRDKVDPAAKAILLEDSAAVAGLLLAALGIVLAKVTGDPMWDSIGSILVGVILGWVAYQLITENRELLLGKAIPHSSEEKFVRILRSRPAVRIFRDVKTRQLTPESYQLKAEIIFDEAFVAQKLGQTLPEGLQLSGVGRDEALKTLATNALVIVGDELDAIEAEVRQAIPETRHIYLEVDSPNTAEPKARPQRGA